MSRQPCAARGCRFAVLPRATSARIDRNPGVVEHPYPDPARQPCGRSGCKAYAASERTGRAREAAAAARRRRPRPASLPGSYFLLAGLFPTVSSGQLVAYARLNSGDRLQSSELDRSGRWPGGRGLVWPARPRKCRVCSCSGNRQPTLRSRLPPKSRQEAQAGAAFPFLTPLLVIAVPRAQMNVRDPTAVAPFAT